MEGDGVLFRIGISDGKGKYEEFLKQHVNPQRRPEDRRWIPVDLDLSAYANQKVEVIFNTNASLPGRKASQTRHSQRHARVRRSRNLCQIGECRRRQACRQPPDRTCPRLASESPSVPLFDLRPQNESIRQETLDAIARVCDSQQFVLGPEVRLTRARAVRSPPRPSCGWSVVGDRRADRRPDDRRHRSWRRGHHQPFHVLRDRRQHHPRGRHAGVRRHRSSDVQPGRRRG